MDRLPPRGSAPQYALLAVPGEVFDVKRHLPEMPERHEHGKNLTGKVRIEPCAKSFIFGVYDVLAGHKTLLMPMSKKRSNSRARLSVAQIEIVRQFNDCACANRKLTLELKSPY
jgi:hypothetical protein